MFKSRRIENDNREVAEVADAEDLAATAAAELVEVVGVVGVASVEIEAEGEGDEARGQAVLHILKVRRLLLIDCTCLLGLIHSPIE